MVELDELMDQLEEQMAGPAAAGEATDAAVGEAAEDDGDTLFAPWVAAPPAVEKLAARQDLASRLPPLRPALELARQWNSKRLCDAFLTQVEPARPSPIPLLAMI
jgi:hypothetical protein